MYQQSQVPQNYASITGAHQVGGNAAMRTIHANQVQPDPAKPQHLAGYGNARANSQPRLPQTSTNRTQVASHPGQGSYIVAQQPGPIHGQIPGQIAAYNQTVSSSAFVTSGPPMPQLMYTPAPFNSTVPPIYYGYPTIRHPVYHQAARVNYQSASIPTSVPQTTVLGNQQFIPQQQTAPQRMKPRPNRIPIVDPNSQKEVFLTPPTANDSELQETVISLSYVFFLKSFKVN